jgi:kynureninase
MVHASPPAHRPVARHPELVAYRDEFPLLARSIYLNTCSLGARSVRSDARLARFLDRWDELGARAWYRHWLDDLDELRAGFGRVIGGRPSSEVALAPNVSVALAVAASGIEPLHRGDARLAEILGSLGVAAGAAPRPKVVTSALDFPTLAHQWLARTDTGVEVQIVPSEDGLTVPLAAFERAVDDRTALVATGHVYFTTGAAQDLRALARMCHDRGALLLVDGYQATGLLPTDLVADGVDVYLSGTLKWLFGGPGNAFLWVRPDLAPHLTPSIAGWFGSARQFAFDVAALDRAPDARRFELGTPALPSSAIALGGLELVDEIGIERLHARTLDLGDLTAELGRRSGLRVRALPAAERGGIVTVAVAEPKPVVDALAARGMVVDFRPGTIRLSPAFYNTEDEVTAVMAALDALVSDDDRA